MLDLSLQVKWFKGSEIAHELKEQARREKKLQAAYSELGVAVGHSGATHAVQALHTAVEVDAITGHHGTNGERMENAWLRNGSLPGNP